MSLYHFLDPLWSKFPFPYRCWFKEEQLLDGVHSLHVARTYGGQKLISVRVYCLGDTLIDTGCAGFGEIVAKWGKAHGATKVFVTHHHEDHSGNIRYLQQQGFEVFAPPMTSKIVRNGFPVHFYQHLAWGKLAPATPHVISSSTFSLGNYQAEVIPAPGHAIDQVVLYIKEKGWLFSADTFIHEKVKLFRGDEDFPEMIKTIEKMLELEFDALFCGHRPRLKNGKQALQQKWQWLKNIEKQAQELQQEGKTVSQIAKQLLSSNWQMRILSGGDVSEKNMISSILFGAKPRPEIQAILESENS